MERQLDRRAFLKLAAAVAAAWARVRSAAAVGRWPDSRPQATLEIVSVRAERVHLVAAGSTTTYVVAVTNGDAAERIARLALSSVTLGWEARLFEADRLFRAKGRGESTLACALQPSEQNCFVVQVSPDRSQPEGSTGTVEIQAAVGESMVESIRLRARVRNTPKIYLVAYDGLGHDYVRLDRRGEYDQAATEPLMPYVRAFLADSAYLPEGRALMPSITDPNHVSLLTGSWPGTTGAMSVGQYFCGLDGEGKPIIHLADSRFLLWGSQGEAIKSIFHLAKDPDMGGDPEAFNALIVGKAWIGSYFRDGQGTVEIIANGYTHPAYLPPPETYVMGDPPSDEDAETDRDGWNLLPPRLFRTIPHPPYGTKGNNPEEAPTDRWVMGDGERTANHRRRGPGRVVRPARLRGLCTAPHRDGRPASRVGSWPQSRSPVGRFQPVQSTRQPSAGPGHHSRGRRSVRIVRGGSASPRDLRRVVGGARQRSRSVHLHE
jgi:hypothetical protein